MLVPLTVRDVMTSPAVTIAVDATARAGAMRLHEADVGSLIVLDDGEPVGILTDSDVVGMVAAAIDPDSTLVAEPMSSPLETIDADASLEAAASSLQSHDVKRLPVYADDELVGVVSVRDISYYIPSIAVGLGVAPADEGRLQVGGPETAYDEEGWEFTYHDEARTGDGVGVGDVCRFTKRLTEGDIRRFANASGDTNRLHLDDDFAEGTRFGGRIVHGTLVLGVISAALARIPGVTIYLSQDVSFLAPVHPDTIVTATCRIVESLGNGRYQVSTVVVTDAGKTVIEGEATVLIDAMPEAVDVEVAAEPLEA